MTDAFRVENLADEKAAEDALNGETDIIYVCAKCGRESVEKLRFAAIAAEKCGAKRSPRPLWASARRIVYGITMGICAFMWIVTFVTCMI
ncbi:MAG: hypothetical protein ACLUSP_01755 [Christensenellales bacterium]